MITTQNKQELLKEALKLEQKIINYYHSFDEYETEFFDINGNPTSSEDKKVFGFMKGYNPRYPYNHQRNLDRCVVFGGYCEYPACEPIYDKQGHWIGDKDVFLREHYWIIGGITGCEGENISDFRYEYPPSQPLLQKFSTAAKAFLAKV